VSQYASLREELAVAREIEKKLKNELAEARQALAEMLAHEEQTHDVLGSILGRGDSLEQGARRLRLERDSLRTELAVAQRDVAELLALSDIVVKVENRAALVAEVRKRYGLDAAIDVARGEQ